MSLLDKQHLQLSRYRESQEFLQTKCKLLALSADKPLAHTSAQGEHDEEDQDGLTPGVLWAKFEDEVTLNDWLVPAEAALKRVDVIFTLRLKILLQTNCLCCRCRCGECAKENLTGALEYRCCKEIAQVRQKLTFDGSIEHLKCIT